jgi:hypothetical protein
MMQWNIRNFMDAKGWTNAHQLAAGAGLSYPVAERIVHGPPPDRIDARTLEKLRVAFIPRAKTPWALIEYTPDPRR